jgi:tripartite-type tricarboxylate transporter receptor subunit TctC
MADGAAWPTIHRRRSARCGQQYRHEAVVRAPPDRYTLLEVTVANAIGASLYDKLSFNFIRDIAPVTAISRGAFVMVVNPSFPTRTVREFIAYAKANPGKVNMATSGIGTGPQIAGELFKMMAGIDMTQVPYRGGAPAISAVIGGEVQVGTAITSTADIPKRFKQPAGGCVLLHDEADRFRDGPLNLPFDH